MIKKLHRLFLVSLSIVLLMPGLSSAELLPFTQKDLNSVNSRENYYDDAAEFEGCTASHGTAGMSERIPEPHRTVISNAASEYAVNPNLLAALFLTEQGNIWKPFEGPYASSPVGASGPFQFMPLTWEGFGVDGNADGIIDIQNFEDAAYAAAAFSASGTNTETPLGSITNPYVPDTILYFAASYNWGIGNVQSNTNESSPLSAGPEETENYLSNIYSLFTSDFTESGHPNYNNPVLSGGESVGQSSVTTACTGDLVGLITNDPVSARNIILSSSQITWGAAGSAPEQKEDVASCMTDDNLFALATIVERAGVNIPMNGIATDHSGCTGVSGVSHAAGAALDIGYFGKGGALEALHTDEGDRLFTFLYNNRVSLRINELIWQNPP
ncbi:MAG: hypothetical protein ACI9T8_000630, partial [Candidatus Saccharimonadales bacterium]